MEKILDIVSTGRGAVVIFDELAAVIQSFDILLFRDKGVPSSIIFGVICVAVKEKWGFERACVATMGALLCFEGL